MRVFIEKCGFAGAWLALTGLCVFLSFACSRDDSTAAQKTAPTNQQGQRLTSSDKDPCKGVTFSSQAHLSCSKPVVHNDCAWIQFVDFFAKTCSSESLQSLVLRGEGLSSWHGRALAAAETPTFEVRGDVIVEKTHLSSLAQLDQNPQSPTFGQCVAGLCHLQKITQHGSLIVRHNPKLKAITQLRSLMDIPGALEIMHNPLLEEIGGYTNPQKSDEYWDFDLSYGKILARLVLENNPQLKSVTLAGTRKIDSNNLRPDLIVRGAPRLEKFSFPAGLIMVKTDFVLENVGLRHLDMPELYEFTDFIVKSTQLEAIDLPALGCQPHWNPKHKGCFATIRMKGDTHIVDNPKLAHLKLGSPSTSVLLHSWGGLIIENNPHLKHIDLNKFVDMRHLQVTKNPRLVSLQSNQLEKVGIWWGGGIDIRDNPKLEEISFPHLRAVGDPIRGSGINIQLNPNLKTGFPKVELGNALKGNDYLQVSGSVKIGTPDHAKINLTRLRYVGRAQNKQTPAWNSSVDLTWPALVNGGGLGALEYVEGSMEIKGIAKLADVNLVRLAALGSRRGPSGNYGFLRLGEEISDMRAGLPALAQLGSLDIQSQALPVVDLGELQNIKHQFRLRQNPQFEEIIIAKNLKIAGKRRSVTKVLVGTQDQHWGAKVIESCGNGQVDADEACDSTAAKPYGQQSCAGAQFTKGNIGCFPAGHPHACHLDYSACYSCGDKVVHPDFEECDHGTNNGEDELCNSDCTLTYCGDGIRQEPNGTWLVNEGCEVDDQCKRGEECSEFFCECKPPRERFVRFAGHH